MCGGTLTPITELLGGITMWEQLLKMAEQLEAQARELKERIAELLAQKEPEPSDNNPKHEPPFCPFSPDLYRKALLQFVPAEAVNIDLHTPEDVAKFHQFLSQHNPQRARLIEHYYYALAQQQTQEVNRQQEETNPEAGLEADLRAFWLQLYLMDKRVNKQRNWEHLKPYVVPEVMRVLRERGVNPVWFAQQLWYLSEQEQEIIMVELMLMADGHYIHPEDLKSKQLSDKARQLLKKLCNFFKSEQTITDVVETIVGVWGKTGLEGDDLESRVLTHYDEKLITPSPEEILCADDNTDAPVVDKFRELIAHAAEQVLGPDWYEQIDKPLPPSLVAKFIQRLYEIVRQQMLS